MDAGGLCSRSASRPKMALYDTVVHRCQHRMGVSSPRTERKSLVILEKWSLGVQKDEREMPTATWITTPSPLISAVHSMNNQWSDRLSRLPSSLHLRSLLLPIPCAAAQSPHAAR
jgi:hypothetical protein